MSCLFCKIIAGEVPGSRVFEDDEVVVIRDIQPQAPIHYLIIPRHHIPTIDHLESKDTALMGHMMQVAKAQAKEAGLSEAGYRLVFNVNAGGGQTVFHIHLHLLGGRTMQWPPG